MLQRHGYRPDGGGEVGDGQAEREQLAIDHPVAQARSHPEADAARQGLDPLVHPLAVARLGGGQAVAQHHPVDGLARRRRADLAAVPDGFGIEAGALQLQGHRVDNAQHVEVHEAVVHRGDDQVGLAVSRAAHRGVAPGGVDQHIVGGLGRVEHCLEPGQGLRLTQLGEFGAGQVLHGHGRLDAVGLQPRPAMGEEMGHGLLAQVQVEDRELGAGMQQGRGDMDRQGGLARPALLVADDDDLGLGHDETDSTRRPALGPIR